MLARSSKASLRVSTQCVNRADRINSRNRLFDREPALQPAQILAQSLFFLAFTSIVGFFDPATVPRATLPPSLPPSRYPADHYGLYINSSAVNNSSNISSRGDFSMMLFRSSFISSHSLNQDDRRVFSQQRSSRRLTPSMYSFELVHFLAIVYRHIVSKPLTGAACVVTIFSLRFSF